MIVTVDILKTGFSELNIESNIMKANCTSSLILDHKNNVIVDTLTAWDSEYLKEALEKKKLTPNDITHVVCTHGHSDHVGNLNLFTNALHIVGQSVSQKEEYILHSFEENPYRISDNIEVIATPGHTLSDVSVIVKGTSYGTVAVVGDLFEKQEDIKDPDIWVKIAGSENPSLQYENRQKILQLADYIIPGHGPGFHVSDELKKHHTSLEPKFREKVTKMYSGGKINAHLHAVSSSNSQRDVLGNMFWGTEHTLNV